MKKIQRCGALLRNIEKDPPFRPFFHLQETPAFKIKFKSYTFVAMQKTILFLVSLILSIDATAVDIEVRGKVINPCTINSGIKIRDYNVMGSEFKEVTLNASHEFSYHFDITEPKQLSVKAGAMHIDFLATAKEKVYNIENYCDKTHGDTMIIKNSI